MVDEMQRSSSKERGRRLRLVRKMSGLTLQELSAKYNFGTSTIKYWECAKSNGLSSKGAKKMVIAMQKQGVQCSYMWLMYGVGLPPQFVDVCYNNSVSGDNNRENIGYVELTAYEEEKSIECEISLFCEKLSQAIALTVSDDGMAPFYSIGDSIGGRRLYKEDIIKAIGKDCIVETTDNQLLCRRVTQGNGEGNFNLYCINPNTLANPPHHYDIKLLSAAPISRVWRRISWGK